MVIRFRVETNRPTQHFTLHVSSVSHLPKSYSAAFNDPNYKNAMCDEYNALINNRTWVLVPRPSDTNIIRCMWLFRHKYLADGTLSRYKARLVANGSTQSKGIDVEETFSPVVKPSTIRTVLGLAISLHWPIHQLDVKNAFLHGDLSKTVYMYQPPGFHDSTHPDYVCLLQRSLNGLKQVKNTAYLLLYVDNIVLTASSETLLKQIICSLHQEFFMTDLGSLNYFLGISITCDSTGMFLSQREYAVEILERAGMVGCNFSRTPIDTESKLGDEGDPVSDPTLYQSLAGSLQYLTFTCPDISYAVQQRQPTLSHSSAEAEYCGVANALAETCWLRNLLRKLHTPLSFATLVYYDNVSAVHLSSNPVQHQCTKHIEIDIHFVCDLVVAGQ
nr:ribonuclease H-like domain-containing protein [Tanacetum cinerariifolium]